MLVGVLLIENRWLCPSVGRRQEKFQNKRKGQHKEKKLYYHFNWLRSQCQNQFFAISSDGQSFVYMCRLAHPVSNSLSFLQSLPYQMTTHFVHSSPLLLINLIWTSDSSTRVGSGVCFIYDRSVQHRNIATPWFLASVSRFCKLLLWMLHCLVGCYCCCHAAQLQDRNLRRKTKQTHATEAKNHGVLYGECPMTNYSKMPCLPLYFLRCL